MRTGYSPKFLYNSHAVGIPDHLVYILISAQFVKSLWVLIYKYLGIQSFYQRGGKKKYWKCFKVDFKGWGCVCVNTWVWDTEPGFPLASGEHTFTCLLNDQNACDCSPSFFHIDSSEGLSGLENWIPSGKYFRFYTCAGRVWLTWKDSGGRSWGPSACPPWNLTQLLIHCANMNFTHLF